MRVLGLLGVLWFAAMLLHNQSGGNEWLWALMLPATYVTGMIILKD
jgi:hypothetical protein